MAEGMAGKAVFPSQFLFVCEDKIGNPLMVNRFGRIPFLGKEPVPRALSGGEGIPVLENKQPSMLGKLRVSGRTVFRGTDEDPAFGVFDIGTF